MKEVLRDMGFDTKEIEIYLALLKSSNSTVSKLLKHTHIERRTIYDVLERLIQKGRVSYFEENNTRTYSAIDPDILLEDIKEKQKNFEKIIPQLSALKETPQGTKVEILKGVKGLQTIFNEIISNKLHHYSYGDIMPFNVDQEYVRHTMNFLRRMEEQKLTEEVILIYGTKIEKRKGGKYLMAGKEFSFPSPTVIYGDVVAQFIYTKPLTIIKITSKEVAKTHIQYFKQFWKQIERKNKVT